MNLIKRVWDAWKAREKERAKEAIALVNKVALDQKVDPVKVAEVIEGAGWTVDEFELYVNKRKADLAAQSTVAEYERAKAREAELREEAERDRIEHERACKAYSDRVFQRKDERDQLTPKINSLERQVQSARENSTAWQAAKPTWEAERAELLKRQEWLTGQIRGDGRTHGLEVVCSDMARDITQAKSEPQTEQIKRAIEVDSASLKEKRKELERFQAELSDVDKRLRELDAEREKLQAAAVS